MLRFLPPLVIGQALLAEALDVLEAAFVQAETVRPRTYVRPVTTTAELPGPAMPAGSPRVQIDVVYVGGWHGEPGGPRPMAGGAGGRRVAAASSGDGHGTPPGRRS